MHTRILHYERELKALVRRQLDRVEIGLVEADGGRERVVATGKIDITARDRHGHFVVIELKAGPCPQGALEQVLAYTSDLETETGTPCRAVLLAAEFPERIRAAARRAANIDLLTYRVDCMDFATAQPRQPFAKDRMLIPPGFSRQSALSSSTTGCRRRHAR